jgi:hypothetical protein
MEGWGEEESSARLQRFGRGSKDIIKERNREYREIREYIQEATVNIEDEIRI